MGKLFGRLVKITIRIINYGKVSLIISPATLTWYPSHSITFFLKKKLEDISPFHGATDIPVLDFWWCLHWVPKPAINYLNQFN